MITLVIATRNEHKVREIRAILGSEFLYCFLDDFGDAPEIIEDAPTCAGNAAKKSVGLAGWLGEQRSTGRELLGDADAPAARRFVLADDSGLEVDALGGAPGVHSARFATLDNAEPVNAPSAANNTKLLRLLENVPPENRAARFRCVLALTRVRSEPQEKEALPESRTEFFEGVCEGRIALEPRGSGGFGYDPLFVPLGFAQSFAELGEEIKNRLSHRALALGKLKRRLASVEKL